MTSSTPSRAASIAAAAANLDDITASLFYQLRDKNRVYDFDILQCPKCPERLEALELDLYKENGQTYQRIWWTCRGIKNQSCHFPLWVPREVFWTRRTEEQMKSGYIPLPNIHLLPQRLWYLYPNVFRDKLKKKGIIPAKKDKSGTTTPSSGHATRGSSVRPESVLTENEECSQDSFRSTPLPSTASNAHISNEMEVWESEAPIRHIRIDEEEVEENFESLTGIRESDVNLQPNPLEQNGSGWNGELDLKSAETAGPSPDPFAHTFVHFFAQNDQQQQQQQQGDIADLREELSDDNEVVLEVLRTLSPDQDSRDVEKTPEPMDSAPEIPRKRRQKINVEESDEVSGSLDRISLVLPSKPACYPEPRNIAKMREVFQNQKQKIEPESDAEVVASVVREVVLKVALQLVARKVGLIKSVVRPMISAKEYYRSPKTVLLEEAKKDFGDLTLDEFLKGVNEIRKSAAAANAQNLNNLRKSLKVDVEVKQEKSVNAKYPKIGDSEAYDNLEMKPSSSRRRSNGIKRKMPEDVNIDEESVAAVEMALKQSLTGTKGPEETVPPPRMSILKGSPSEFRHDMISGEIFDPLNWRRPVHFGGHTNLDAFVTAYNLRYNRAQYLDALGSELCKRKIMKFVPSIPVKQQRLVRQMQQKQSGRDDTLDLEKLKKAVDPTALRLQIAHRLGIKNLESITLNGKTQSSEEVEVNISQMQHIGSIPSGAVPEANSSMYMEYVNYAESSTEPSVSYTSESSYSFPVSEFDQQVNAEKERELQASYIPSFNDPEVDALVHRKFKNYAHDESVNESVAEQPPPKEPSNVSENLDATASRIVYADFENAFEEYDDDVQQLDPIFDTHFGDNPTL